jgi:hypothetical protein
MSSGQRSSAQGGPEASSPLRSDSSRDCQAGGWTAITVAKNVQIESWKTTLGSQGTYLKPVL